ncbi:uncharacterized protein SPAPADRAFT_63103 [Spathaspora passalidarum NRRL Y-27907]|uniref:Uncharacterized protein n=1 Tax=Spathaspora passalidarum (strain NRRL Y-27907 / 11-Y1) TaxID=619300 RepID=G3AUH2_SPAPN|nr:uncharacterized protein SPAPADRAFT_63103 [Spathaspora passalidarum NRRL Y-27907]EGW30258.1 hypothetical protein SPAPADRAFT_63103 [Spathaspora passalidarum NRRL Y-27907]
MSSNTSVLLEPNAKLIHLLPSNLQDLIQYETVYDIILQSLDTPTRLEVDVTYLKKQLLEREETIDKSILELTVDEDKSVILSMLYGSTFIQAIDIVLNKCIKYESKVNLQDYLRDPLQYKNLAKFTIIDQTVSERTITKLLLLLGFKLQNGILMEADSTGSDSQDAQGIEHNIDLDNWYCNCSEYQLQYTSNMKPIEITENRTLIEGFLSHSESIVLEPIPLCSHMLAILIILYNKEKLYSRIHR